MGRSSILIVIDSGQLRRTVTAMVLTQGWEVIEASVPIRPAPAAAHHTPALVIADRCYGEFPEVVAFTRNLRRLYPAIPIILIAERSSEEQVIAALKAGVNDYIKQPFAEDELVAAVRRCLSGRESKNPRKDHPKQLAWSTVIGWWARAGRCATSRHTLEGWQRRTARS